MNDDARKAQGYVSKTIQILTNLTCNLDCTYCYETKNGKVNDINTIRGYLDACFTELNKGSVIVECIGGEAFLYPELLREIFEHALYLARKAKVCLTLSVCTNGTTLNDPKVRRLIDDFRDWLSVGISIDGPPDLHDRYRKFCDGKGSYVEAVRHLDWLRRTLPRKVGVKATFTLDSFLIHYLDAIRHLVELGFEEIAANIVYEDHVGLEKGAEVYQVLKQVIDYLFDNGLHDKVEIFQLTRKDLASEMFRLQYSRHDSEKNYCGSCTYMTCLGFDGKVYGCNRFCTMTRPGMEIGEFVDRKIRPVNQALVTEVVNQYTAWPTECLKCPLGERCPACVAAPYETGDPKGYLNEKRMCGWTHAQALAQLYMKRRLENEVQ